MPVNISNACIGCQSCISTCPYGALYINDEGLSRVIADKCVECGKCVEICPVGAMELPAGAAGGAAAENISPSCGPGEPDRAGLSGSPSRSRGVWVFVEQREGLIAPVSLELLGEGKKLAEKLGVELSGVLLGSRVSGLVDRLYACGSQRVYLLDHPALLHYRSETYMRAFVKLVKEYLPEIILMGATTTGRDLAGAVATELGTALTADCTGLDIDLRQRLLLATRPAFGGNIMATIVAKKHRPQMASVRPGVMKMPKPAPVCRGELVRPDMELNESEMLTRVIEIVKEQGKHYNLQDAEIIVAGGRGLGDRESFREICHGLAGAIGARVGASRAAVEAGWIEQQYQVGQTGVTVSPKIYIALGISGAVQHLVGIRGSDIIIAVNNNPEAPIFKECTYGIVGDLFKIAPLLKEPLKELLNREKTDLDGLGVINCAG